MLTGCPELTTLDREDALICFEDHIRSLERELEDEQKRERRRMDRQQRKNREAFIVLLEELHEQGQLHSMSMWSELYLMISKDDRFHSMLGQSGSTPLDLFKFYIENLKGRYQEDRKVISDILSSQNFTVSTTTSFETFANVLAEDKRYLELDPGNIKQAYNRYCEKALSAEREKLRAEAKKIHKTESAFRMMLRELTDPAVTLDSKWEDVKSRIEDKDEFKAIDNEEERERLFADYLEILEEVCQHRHSKHKHSGKRKKKDKRGDADDGCSSPEVPVAADEYAASKRAKRERRDSESRGRSDSEEPGEMRETKKKSKKDKKRRHHRRHKKSKEERERKRRRKDKDEEGSGENEDADEIAGNEPNSREAGSGEESGSESGSGSDSEK